MKVPFHGEIPPHLAHLEWDRSLELLPHMIYLSWADNRLSLVRDKESFSIDLTTDWYYHYRKRYSLSKEPLARALGIKGRPGLTVWDLTCGLGKDSLLMLSFGAHVEAFERDPVVAALFLDGLERAGKDCHLSKVLTERFSFFHKDGVQGDGETPDVIYLDPMYDFVNKRAKASLGMEFLREITEFEDNGQKLLDWALSKKPGRVVIKRAIRAPSMNPNPKVCYRGKSTRYDMYIPSEVSDFS